MLMVEMAANEAHPWVTLVVVMVLFVVVAITSRVVGSR